MEYGDAPEQAVQVRARQHRRTAAETDHVVAVIQKVLRQQHAVLAGNAGNESAGHGVGTQVACEVASLSSIWALATPAACGPAYAPACGMPSRPACSRA